MTQVVKDAKAKAHKVENKAEPSDASLRYQPGFGNHFVSEAVAGALPVGRNSPQRPPLGLYAEQISGTSFTTARAENRHTWTYRIQPSVVHRPYARIDNGLIRSAPFNEADATPTQLRWSPFQIPQKPTDFVEGIVTLGGNGDVATQVGMAVHIYAANRSMDRSHLLQCRRRNADRAAAGPRPFRHRAWRCRSALRRDRYHSARSALSCRSSRRSIARLHLRELWPAPAAARLGPLGANGLANTRDFLAPVAAYEDKTAPHSLVAKFQGNLWAAEMNYSPLNVVAWHGNFAPYKYDLARFNVMGSVSFDHPDPSIFSVLTAPSIYRARRRLISSSSRRAGSLARIRSGRHGITATS